MQTCKLGVGHALATRSSRIVCSRRFNNSSVAPLHKPAYIAAFDRADRDIAAEFRRSRSWAPSYETIDDDDRKKRLQITLRFEDVDKDR